MGKSITEQKAKLNQEKAKAEKEIVVIPFNQPSWREL